MPSSKRSPSQSATGEVRVVRRPREERKRLSPELEAFARGDDDAIWRREIKGRLNDPRVAVLIPGLKNSDARLLHDAYVNRIRSALESGDEERLAELMAVVRACGIYRGHRFVSFEAFAEALFDIDSRRANALASEGEKRLGLPSELSEAEIATWMRAEAGVLSVTPEGRVEVRNGMLHLSVPFDRAAEALAQVSHREFFMSKNTEGPKTIVDRPKGLPPLSAIIERVQPQPEVPLSPTRKKAKGETEK
ncbi:MAG: hypothetical protein RMJ84_10550 [Sandaracinaceae bacterium]|nr:hypothetical protein [Sandaracinaceae bacterium]